MAPSGLVTCSSPPARATLRAASKAWLSRHQSVASGEAPVTWACLPTFCCFQRMSPSSPVVALGVDTISEAVEDPAPFLLPLPRPPRLLAPPLPPVGFSAAGSTAACFPFGAKPTACPFYLKSLRMLSYFRAVSISAQLRVETYSV